MLHNRRSMVGPALAALLLASCAGRARPPAGAPAPAGPWRHHVIAQGFESLTALAGDFTGDGRLDVIAADTAGGRTLLYATPGWRPVELHRGAGSIHSVAFDVDVDGDGDDDYLGTQYEPGLVFWLERPPVPLGEPWTFRRIDAADAGGVDGVHGLATGDLDGDGRIELVANSNEPAGPVRDSVVYYRVPPDARAAGAWPRALVADGDAPGFNHYLGVGDLDGDGRAEVATGAKFGNYFAFWRRGDQPGRPWVKQALPGSQPGATHALVADVDRDGANDLVVSRGHGQGVAWFPGPRFDAARGIDPALVAPHSLTVGDLDGDGDLDVATVTTTSATVAWFENDGAGGFRRHDVFAGQSGYDIRLADMDGDRDLDLLVAGQQSRNVVWFESPIAR